VSAAFAIVLLALVSALGGLVWLRTGQRQTLRERLLFGIAVEEAPEAADLAAGDYGLSGRRRFAYHTARFLQTLPGRGLTLALGAGAGNVAALAGGLSAGQAAGAAAGAGVLSLLGVQLVLRAGRRRFERAVHRELPSALELLAAIMEGGLGFDAALEYVLAEADPEHPLYFDLGVVSEAMRQGRRRAEALRLWVTRCNIAPVADISAALIQADQTGGSLGSVLHHHARAMFRDNEAEIERRAERLPIRMIMPLFFTIFPAVFVVAGLPSFLRILRVFSEITKGAARVSGSGG
jgi:tight adherence protein C